MLRHSATVVTATNELTSLWRGNAQAIPVSPTPDQLIVEITEEEYSDIGGKGMHYRQGPPRFVWNGTAIVEQADTRKDIRFTPATVDLDVNDPPVTVTVEVLLPNGDVDTGYNEARKVVTVGDRRLRLTFASGVATFKVRASREHQVGADSMPEFRMVAPLEIRVAATELD